MSGKRLFVNQYASFESKPATMAEEPLLAAPRFIASATCLLMLGLFFKLCIPGNGMLQSMLAFVPLQLYWSFCLYRLSLITGAKFGIKPPLSESTVFLITLAALVCLPRFDSYPIGLYAIDPFFWIWMVTQLAGPLILGLTIQKEAAKQEKQAVANPYLLPVTLACLANAYLLLLFVPAPAFFSMFFLPAWTVGQFVTLSALNIRLRNVFSNDLKLVKVLKAKSVSTAFLSQDYSLALNYKGFAGVEKWFKERFSGSSGSRATKLIAGGLLAPFLLAAAFYCISQFSAFGPSSPSALVGPVGVVSAGGVVHANIGTASSVMYNTMFMQAFLGAIAATFALGFGLYVRQPTQFLLGRKGVKMLWRHRLWFARDLEIPWSKVKQISYENPSDSRLFASKKICLETDDQTLKLSLSAIDNMEDKEAILRAIEKWAPGVKRDAEVEQLLLPSSDHSYTELWLQALSAPPKRERLKPLLEQSLLQEGRYQVLGALGVGGQGSAYSALDRINNVTVVLKEFILPVFVNVKVRKSALEQFENEAKILRQLDNDQIVKLLDFFVEDHRAYLVLEHIDGTSLRSLVEKKGALQEPQVRNLALQMCHILEYLHGLTPPVVHRDFTPDNLILRNDGTLKLIDFNVAQQIEETTTGTVVGKHAYLPPEQFRGETTSQSDLYALGATLFYLLVGEDPEAISASKPNLQNEKVSQDLSDIVARATCLSEDERFKTAAEIETALKK